VTGRPEVVVIVGDHDDDAVTMHAPDQVTAVRRALWTVLGRALAAVAAGVVGDLVTTHC
jgi:hypothetical protein